MWSTARTVLSWCSTTFGGASSPDELANNLNNINGLKFYHSIRGNLKFSRQPCQALPHCERPDPLVEGGRPRSGDGTLLCPAQLPGALESVAANDLIGINSTVEQRNMWG